MVRALKLHVTATYGWGVSGTGDAGGVSVRLALHKWAGYSCSAGVCRINLEWLPDSGNLTVTLVGGCVAVLV